MIDYDAEIERVLADPPSKIGFRTLCAVIGRAADPEDLLSRCEERLKSWPEEMREAPWSRLAALNAGYTTPSWPLVRSLTLGSAPLGTRDARLPDPRIVPEVRGIRRLDLGYHSPDEMAEVIGLLDHWDALRALRCSGYWSDEVIDGLAGTATVARLESLDLERCWKSFRPVGTQPLCLRHAALSVPDLAHLMRTGRVPHLRSAEVCVPDIDQARELAQLAELAQLERLTIEFACGKNRSHPRDRYFGIVNEEDDQACEVFFAHADLTNLRALTVRGGALGQGRTGFGASGVDAIVASGVLPRLIELTLDALPLGDGPIAHVVTGLDRDRIERLTLTDLVATDGTPAALAAAGALPRLRRLDLSRNCLGPTGAQVLATGVELPALEYLDLSGRPAYSPYYSSPEVQEIGDTAAAAWATSPNATNLTHLNLAATGLGIDGLVAVLYSVRLQRLHTLDLSENPAGAWPAELRDAPLWRTVRTLNLAECGLHDDDIEALASTSAAPHLHSVSLAYNSVGSRGARALAGWALLPRLWELNLHDNIIGDDGLIGLARSGRAQRLLELDIEQDCRNSQRLNHGFSACVPPEVVEQAAFPNLDSILLGVVDEYHRSRSVAGYPIDVFEEVITADRTRPELAAFLAALDTDQLWTPSEEPEEPDGMVEFRQARMIWWMQQLHGPDYQIPDPDFRAARADNHLGCLEHAREFAAEATEWAAL